MLQSFPKQEYRPENDEFLNTNRHMQVMPNIYIYKLAQAF